MMKQISLVFLFLSILSAQALTRPVLVSWSASPTPGVIGYNVSRGTAVSGPFTLLTTTPIAGLTYTDNTALVGGTYTYQIVAVAAPCTPASPVDMACGAGLPGAATTTVPPSPGATMTVSVNVQ